jgi:hypothetical protein
MGQAASTEDEPSISGSSDHKDEEGSIKSDSDSGEAFRPTEKDDEQIPSLCPLESLTDEQLEARLDGIQREDILAAAAVEIGQPTTTESSINMAKRILELSPELRQLRFHLVPSRIKEDVFWEAVFSILRQKGTKVRHDDLNSLPPKKIPQKKPLVRRMESGNPSVVEELHHKLERRNQEIARLHQELNEMKQRIARMEASSSTNVVQKGNTTPCCCHKGKWMMDKDSLEFLAYPDELKSNLREQKQKRFEQIRANMKFILDTDNVEDSNGSWDCCGETSYNAQGCSK